MDISQCTGTPRISGHRCLEAGLLAHWCVGVSALGRPSLWGMSPKLPTQPEAGGRSHPSSWNCPHVTSSGVTLNPGELPGTELPGTAWQGASRTHEGCPCLSPQEARILLGVIFLGRDGGDISHALGWGRRGTCALDEKVQFSLKGLSCLHSTEDAGCPKSWRSPRKFQWTQQSSLNPTFLLAVLTTLLCFLLF